MHHYPIAYHPNIQKTKKQDICIHQGIHVPIHTYITSYHSSKRGIHVPNTLELLASMCSINIKQIIKRIHVRTNETPTSKNVHPRAYIYIYKSQHT